MLDLTSRSSIAPNPLAPYRRAIGVVIVLSAVLNILLLGGSIYMMLIYDSVLPSQNVATLIGLLGLIVIVFLAQGFFDIMRSRILADIGIGIDRSLSPKIQRAMAITALRGQRVGDGLTPMRDLDHIRTFLSGPGPSALIDLPWVVFFLGVLSLLHIWLGITALVGALILTALTLVNNIRTSKANSQLSQIAAKRNQLAESNLRHVETLSALGMRDRMTARWDEVNSTYLGVNDDLARSTTVIGGSGKVFRMFLQSAVLTVGALLVIDGQATGGIIIASSILSGRALAPVDQAIANWKGFSAATQGWKRINSLFEIGDIGNEALPTSLPAPERDLVVEELFVAPPGGTRPTIEGISFELEAGEGLGIIGPSAAGKTTLARALINLWPPMRGTVRLDGAALDQWDSEMLGKSLGYLPQAVELLEGTVAQNIARFDPEADDEEIIRVAQMAGVHDMIVRLPDGYDTPVGLDGAQLSAGQKQRVGLARALYGDPFLVVLDEPNSNLDAEGEAALTEAVQAVRERGGIAVIIAHRPSALAAVSKVLVVKDGRASAFGPRDEILGRLQGIPSQQPASAPANTGDTAVTTKVAQ